MRHYSPPTVAPDDEFDMYGLELELGTWSYILDDFGIVYGPGWYPFHRALTRSEQNPSAPLLNRAVPVGTTKPTGVRLSPNVAEYSWRNEYVLLAPIDHRVQARTRLFVRKQGLGAMVRRITIEVDLRAELVTIPDQCPAALREQAEVKGQRVLDLLQAARRERRRRAKTPTAVLGPWVQDQSAGPQAAT
ncbi:MULTISPECIES: hypothetical protein [Pseudonocardiaceae]|uniref:SRPBCC family protein n=2 Tax=Pseudonocardiaceae TaxID=2070 RepID=A0ABY2RW90_9PSEU|nr:MULTISPECIES: hypothetical protein [Pseudonocardiaceae]TKG62377.1 hypothetical protein FCN18_32210 [Prauserella endophytica]WIV57913.1 hypothetical protein QP939_04315 [Amycolatopsis sp. 2-2]